MSLDMLGHIDDTFRTRLPGGIVLRSGETGDYGGPGGKWRVLTPAQERPLHAVNVQPVSMKTVEMLSSALGGTFNPNDLRSVHINDGTQIYPDDTGKFAEVLLFHDGVAMRQWRVISSDNRADRNYCKVIVQRYMDTSQ